MIEFWMKKHLISDSNYNIVMYNAQIKEWQTTLGSYLVLVTLHMQMIFRATSHMRQEPWPWNCESPKEIVQRPSQGTSNII